MGGGAALELVLAAFTEKTKQEVQNGHGKARSNLRSVVWLSPQPVEPSIHDRATNLSRVLQLRREVRLFTAANGHKAPFGALKRFDHG